MGADPNSRTTALWLSHHWPENYDRCVTVGRTHVCRRCLVMYPVVIAGAIVVAVTGATTNPLLIAAMWLLPAPMVAEWVLEHARQIDYSPVRQSILSAVAGIGFGVALGLHVRHPFTLVALAPVMTAVVICCLSVLVSSLRHHDADRADWLAAHEQAETERRAHLVALLGQVDDATPTDEPATSTPDK